jgi:hypothetical protein
MRLRVGHAQLCGIKEPEGIVVVERLSHLLSECARFLCVFRTFPCTLQEGGRQAVGGLFFLSNSQGCCRHHATAPNSIPEPIAPIESICCATRSLERQRRGPRKNTNSLLPDLGDQGLESVCLTPYPYVVSIGLRASSFKPNFRLDRELATFNSRLSKFGGFATLRDGKQSNRANS